MTDPRQPRVSNQKGYDLPVGFIAAMAVHALLFLGFTFVFQWKTEPELRKQSKPKKNGWRRKEKLNKLALQRKLA